MFDLAFSLVSANDDRVGVSVVYPLGAACKALQADDRELTRKWARYYVVLSVVTFAESNVGFLISWFPFYNVVRLGTYVWLLPSVNTPGAPSGADFVFDTYIDPAVQAHEKDVERLVSMALQTSKARSLEYFKVIASYMTEIISEMFLGGSQRYQLKSLQQDGPTDGQSTSASHSSEIPDTQAASSLETHSSGAASALGSIFWRVLPGMGYLYSPETVTGPATEIPKQSSSVADVVEEAQLAMGDIRRVVDTISNAVTETSGGKLADGSARIDKEDARTGVFNYFVGSLFLGRRATSGSDDGNDAETSTKYVSSSIPVAGSSMEEVMNVAQDTVSPSKHTNADAITTATMPAEPPAQKAGEWVML
ncbi:TB2/DP1, HVA22 family-domain-containing protein [Dipodascopsis tothii]|uniref:TB2/DP1, HVA22 family-domain-containing protein n=1 Tax=Dipodascopsis tothii TaxID=44089 RepID=UPI0034CE83F6